MKKLAEYIKEHPTKITWGLLFLAILVERAILIYSFTLQYVDDDQTIMWNAAFEYGKGNFYEPFFWRKSNVLHFSTSFRRQNI